MKISVVINTYNAEKHLEEVLLSVSNFDEVLICDMHSQDNTVFIANKFGCKVIHHERLSYVEPARNFAIQQAKHPWVLVVDADEVVSADLHQYLYRFIKANQNYQALYIPRKNYFMGKFMRSAYPDYCLRFFKKNCVHYTDKIHAQPLIQGNVFWIDKRDKKLAFEHLANESVYIMAQKNNLYSNQEIIKRGVKNIRITKLFFSPLGWFIKYYILKKGFLDGKSGFIFAYLKAQYKFLTLAKIFEFYSKQK